MRAVLRQIAADLRTRLGASLLILLTLASASTLLTLGIVSLRASASPYQQEMAAANGADVWIWANGGALGRTLYRQVSVMTGVRKMSSLLPAAGLRLLVPGHLKNPYINLIGAAAQNLHMMRPILVAGRYPRPGERNVGLLDDSIAAYYHLRSGQSVRVATGQGVRRIRIVGLDASAVTCLYPNCDPYLYVTKATLNSMVPPSAPAAFYFFGVQLRHPQDANRFLSQVEFRAPKGSLSYGNTWLNVQQFIQASQELQNIFSIVFGVLAALTAVTLSATILGGAVLSRRREMAVLKALGFTRGQLLFVYVGQSALLGLLGGAAGIVLGYMFAAVEMRPLALSMGVPSIVGFQPGYVLVILVSMLVVASLAALLAAFRAASAAPAQHLRQGFDPTGAGGGALFRALSRLRLPPTVMLGCKDVLVRSGRSALSTIGLLVAVLAIALSFGLNQGITSFTRDPLLQGINYSFAVESGVLAPRAAVDLVSHQPTIQRYYTSTQVVASIQAAKVFLPLEVMGGAYTSFRFPVLSGHLPRRPGEVALAPGAVSALSAHIGSEIIAKINGATVRLKVVGIYRSFSNFGEVGMTTTATVQRAIPNLEPSLILVDLRPHVTVRQAVHRLQAAAGNRLGIDRPDLTLPPFISQSLQLLRLLALILAVIAALGVVTATLLTAREQTREIGIRKAVGMSAGQILTAAAVGSGLLGLIGGGIGAPLGSAMDGATLRLLASRFGSGGLNGSLSPGVIGLLILSGIGIALIASLPSAVYALKLRTAQALRAE